MINVEVAVKKVLAVGLLLSVTANIALADLLYDTHQAFEDARVAVRDDMKTFEEMSARLDQAGQAIDACQKDLADDQHRLSEINAILGDVQTKMDVLGDKLGKSVPQSAPVATVQQPATTMVAICEGWKKRAARNCDDPAEVTSAFYDQCVTDRRDAEKAIVDNHCQ